VIHDTVITWMGLLASTLVRIGDCFTILMDDGEMAVKRIRGSAR